MVDLCSILQRGRIPSVVLLTWLIGGAGFSAEPNDTGIKATRSAIAYLARHVSAWPVDNQCFSCHNNGDAARVLYVASRHHYRVPDDALRATTAWLNDPSAWHAGTKDAEFKDKQLAAVQFAAALAAAVEAGASTRNEPLMVAAQQITDFQNTNGGWSVEGSRLGGSPIAYSDLLATAISRDILVRADGRRFAEQISAADQRLRTARAHAMSDLAGIVIGLSKSTDAAANRQRRRCLQQITNAQDRSGGWGPFEDYRPETFDTAIVLLALSLQPNRKDVADMITRGRHALIDTQLGDGSWLETTRPAGADSYAHRISTTAWATLALIATR